jgi:hypothetical protein
MKKITGIISVMIGFSLMTGCKEENPKPLDNGSVISYVATKLGGCNNPEKNIQDSEITNDTVIISSDDERIDVFVGLNYLCGAPFKTECQIAERNIVMYVIDTCETLDCYQRCYCYYTFDFTFQKQENDSPEGEGYRYKIILQVPEKENQLISEGYFEPTLSQ